MKRFIYFQLTFCPSQCSTYSSCCERRSSDMRVTCSAHATGVFFRDGVHVRSAGLCEDVRVRYHVLPPDHQEFAPQTAHVEMVELSGVSAKHCSSFTSTREGGENNGAVNLQVCSNVDFSALSFLVFCCCCCCEVSLRQHLLWQSCC